MYDQNLNVGTVQNSPSTVLGGVKQTLAEINQEQCKFISEIEERLHAVLDRRETRGKANITNEHIGNDFSQQVAEEFSVMRNNTSRLSIVLNHLNEIV